MQRTIIEESVDDESSTPAAEGVASEPRDNAITEPALYVRSGDVQPGEQESGPFPQPWQSRLGPFPQPWQRDGQQGNDDGAQPPPSDPNPNPDPNPKP